MKKTIIIPILILLSFFSCFANISHANREFDEAIKTLSSRLKEKYSLKEQKAMRIAVLPFVNDDGKKSKLGVAVANTLQEYMFAPEKYVLLERERVDSLIEEFSFNNSGYVENVSYEKLGNLLGADVVVLGTLTHTNSQITINSRIVELQTGSILSIAHVNINETKDLVDKYSSYIERKEISINGAYEFTVEQIIVNAFKPNGAPWDPGFDNMESRPDIYYRIYKNNSLVFPANPSIIPLHRNTYEGDFRTVQAKIVLEKDDVISIDVMEKDLFEDDFIGSVIFPPAKLVRTINGEDNEFAFGQVEKMVLRIRKIE